MKPASADRLNHPNPDSKKERKDERSLEVHVIHFRLLLIGTNESMKVASALIVTSLAASAGGFSLGGLNPRATTSLKVGNTADNSDSTFAKEPLLIRAARGEKVERTPVWMMRQAGRHIKEYRDLCIKYPTFRERSEIPDVAVEISLQPWRNYQTDGCILFSDILTPLPGIGCEFKIDEKRGPVMSPMRTWDDVQKVGCKIVCITPQ